MQPQRRELGLGPQQAGSETHTLSHCTVPPQGQPASPSPDPLQGKATPPPRLQLKPSPEHLRILGVRCSYPSWHMGKLRHRDLSTTRETDTGLLLLSLDWRIGQNKTLYVWAPESRAFQKYPRQEEEQDGANVPVPTLGLVTVCFPASVGGTAQQQQGAHSGTSGVCPGDHPAASPAIPAHPSGIEPASGPPERSCSVPTGHPDP